MNPEQYKQMYDIAGLSTENIGGVLGGYTGTPEQIKRTKEVFGIKDVNGVGGGESGGGIKETDTTAFDTASDFFGTTEGKSLVAEQEAKRKAMGILTPEEKQQIEESGKAAGLEYDPLIAEAREEKRKQMPRALIRGGQAGGLLSTQIAGAAALEPVEGGGWVGAGGRLAELSDTYDLAIIKAETAKQKAVADAKILAQKTIMTGKQQDYDNLKSALSEARTNYYESQRLSIEKQNVLQKAQQMAAQAKQDSIKNLQDLAKSGMDIAALTPEETTKYESSLGVQPGGLSTFYEGLKNEELTSRAKDIFAIAKDIPEGQEYKIPGTEMIIKGIKQTSPDMTEVETVVGGKVYKVAYDKITGKELWRVNTNKDYKSPWASGVSKSDSSNETSLKKDIEEFLRGTKLSDPTDANSKQIPILGEDGFISPDDYKIARNTWIKEGGNPTRFDTLFKGYRDPNNPNYNVSKESNMNIEINIPSFPTGSSG